MTATALLHGDIWTILVGILYLFVVYIGLPVAAIVLALKYFRKGKAGSRE